MKIVNIDGENLYLLSDLRNFNDIFRKDVTYDNIKIKKKTRPHPLSERYIFGKTRGGVFGNLLVHWLAMGHLQLLARWLAAHNLLTSTLVILYIYER